MRIGQYIARVRWTLLALALLIMATVAMYAPGIGGGFIFDDYPNIVDNPLVQPQELSVASLSAAAMSSPSSELKRPLSSLSFAVDSLIAGGLSAPAMKVTNIALHALNGVLLYFLLATLFRLRASGPGNERQIALLAGAASLAWLMLPINLTAVLYVVQRMESLANLFVLAGLLGYVHARMRMQHSQGGFLSAAAWAVLPALLGVSAKETSVLLPLYALCVETFVFRFRRGTDDTRIDHRLVWMYAIILGVPLIAGMAWIGPGLLDARTWGTRDFTLRTRLLSEGRIVLDYIGWTVLPTPGDLSFYHDEFVASSGWISPPTTLLSIAALIALMAGLWAIRRRAPLVALGGAWFFACHTLTGTVLPLELIYEHRNYFASIGVVLAVVGGLHMVTQALKAHTPHNRVLRFVPAGTGVALLLWTVVVTAKTVLAWSTPLTLAEELGARGPDSPRGQYELGRAYLIASHYDPASPLIAKATTAFERAAVLPDASILAEQALVFMNGRMGLPVKPVWWQSMRRKLMERPVTVQDDSSLLALASCVEQDTCHFDTAELDRTFQVALGKPTANARLKSAYGRFAAIILRDPTLAFTMARDAAAAAPSEPGYRINYIRLLIARGDLVTARREMDALRSMNIGGRLTDSIGDLDKSLGAARATSTPSP